MSIKPRNHFFPKPSYPPNQGIQISGISTCIIVIYRGIIVSGMVLFTPEKYHKNNVKPSYLTLKLSKMIPNLKTFSDFFKRVLNVFLPMDICMVCYLDAPWAYVCLNQDTSKPGYPNFQRYLTSDLNTYYPYKDIHVSRETILFDMWFDTPKTSANF